MIIDEIMVVQKQDMQKHVRILEITCIHQDEEDSFTVLQFLILVKLSGTYYGPWYVA